MIKLPGFGSKRKPETEPRCNWRAAERGLVFSVLSTDGSALSRPLASPEVPSLLDQLVDDDYAERRDAEFLIPWDKLHELIRTKAYRSSLQIIEIPEVADIAPALISSGTLTDPSFSIGIGGWRTRVGQPILPQALEGAMMLLDGKPVLLPSSSWKLMGLVSEFADRLPLDRTPEKTRKSWGKIRRAALDADAGLDNFLVRSVVVTPEKLDIEFRKTTIGGSTLVEIMPGFEGAPDGWLEQFDQYQAVPPHLNIPTRDGAVHIAFSEPVQSLLCEIKKLPNRRVTGARAEAFLLNPFAALGDDAKEAIDEAQFEAAKQRAGIHFEFFRPHIRKDAAGFPFEVGIEVETSSGGSSTQVFESEQQLSEFVKSLRGRLNRRMPLFAWSDFEFELSGDSEEHCKLLSEALELRQKPPVLIDHQKIFDLSGYTERVRGIGEDQPFISPYIVKKSDEDTWFPTDLLVLLKIRPSNTAEEVTYPLNPSKLGSVAQQVAVARANGDQEVKLDGCPIPLPIGEVEVAIQAVERALVDRPRPLSAAGDATEGNKKQRPTLLIKGNINALDHVEGARELPASASAALYRPHALKPEVELREHQVSGVARMQQLFAVSPQLCRGVLLADDMGLGKTLQILTFLASAFEQDPTLPPAMIVAPISLLGNWQMEIEEYFLPGTLKVTVACGDALAKLRVPRSSIAADLQAEGLVRFLKPGWRSDSQIVLTTYETMRDLEFSFALEAWSILVCDEAQKIKNPNARVTRAAKKLNVRFRIPCTGTPVENSLTDIWCLFDLIQPGLLVPLNEFGSAYGRPIEQGGPDAQAKTEELRAKIDPQVIRRTKADVAKDLPRKIDVANCRLDFSNEQRALYVGAVHGFNREPDADDGKIHHLGLLQYLRLVCADPRRYGVEAFVPEDLAAYRRKSPKMAWLLSTLEKVRSNNEKALIFAEHRDIQRMLQHYIKAAIGVKPQIVNGDTAVSSRAEQSRQKLITEFQAQSGFGVIILSPLAVGFGVNIQAANHVIHFLRHWNPAKEDQATDRAYRIGQKRDVYVYCPLTCAPDFKTFDVKMDELLRSKRALAGDMLSGVGTLGDIEFDLRELLPDPDRTLRDDPITMDVVERANAKFFEALAAALWKKQGYRTILTPQSDDAGIDVVAIRGSEGCLIQCKSSTIPDRALGWDAIKEVVGGTAVYSEQYPTVRFKRICVTNQRFNQRAHDRGRANGVELIERSALAARLQAHPLTMLDVRCLL